MDKKQLSERDICTKFITPALRQAGWDELTQLREEVSFGELILFCDRLEAARAEREAKRERLTTACFARLNRPDPDAARFGHDARFALNVLPTLTARRDQIGELRQTILSLAIRGKLVRHEPSDEPASALLPRIAAMKTQHTRRRRTEPARLVPIAKESAPFPVAASWVWVSFGDITISRDGERVPVSKEQRTARAKVYDYYGASGIIDRIDNYLFDKPLLLIGEDGANLLNRSTPIAFIARGKYWVNNHAHVVDGLSEESLRYLELFINAIDLKPYVTGAAQPKMNQAKMNSIPIALPPIAEQNRILGRVDELMALCDRLEANLSNTETTRRRLLETLLADSLAPVARELHVTH